MGSLVYHRSVNSTGAIQRDFARRSKSAPWLLPILFLLIPASRAFAQTPQVPPAAAEQFQRATEAMRAGNLDQAGDGFAEVARRAPTFAEAFLNLGLVREEQSRHQEAIAAFREVLRLKPKLRGANLFLGIAEYRINQFDASLAALRKETALNPSDANAWMWLGIVALEKGDGDQAVQALDRAAKLAPDNVDILYHRGRAHLFVSNDSYARMFKADPKSWRVPELLAEASAGAERHMDAIAEYQEAIKLAPNEPHLHEELGDEYRLASKPHEAEQAYLDELKIYPENVTAQYKLGVLATELGDGARGKSLIEAALRLKPDLRNSAYNLGRAEMLLGDDALAAEDFERATKADSDPDVLEQSWYQLGTVLRRLHRTQEAQQAFANFQKLKDAEADNLQSALAKFKAKSASGSTEPPLNQPPPSPQYPPPQP
jgi:tetratricopeptide (TPR) repeat protein